MHNQKPYLIRAIYEWCHDNEYTPYLAAQVDDNTTVPAEYVENQKIMLNIAETATKDLQITNEWVTFQATFHGVIHQLSIPTPNVLAIFAKENGQGMQFQLEATEQPNQKNENKPPNTQPGGLKLVK